MILNHKALEMAGLFDLSHNRQIVHILMYWILNFNFIQSSQHTSSPNTINGLIECVQNEVNALNLETLDKVFQTLQIFLEATMNEFL